MQFHIFARPIATATGARPVESYIGTRPGETAASLCAKFHRASYGAFTFRAFKAR